MTPEELAEVMKDVRNVFIDTSIYEHHGFNFFGKNALESVYLAARGNFIDLFITDIVEAEIYKHLKAYASDSYKHVHDGRIGPTLAIQYPQFADFQNVFTQSAYFELLRKSYHEFYGQHMTKIEVNSYVVNLTLSDYIESNPPFDVPTGKKKPDYFKDALSINALKSHFKDDESILVVSRDGDYMRCCDNKRMYCIDN